MAHSLFLANCCTLILVLNHILSYSFKALDTVETETFGRFAISFRVGNWLIRDSFNNSVKIAQTFVLLFPNVCVKKNEKISRNV